MVRFAFASLILATTAAGGTAIFWATQPAADGGGAPDYDALAMARIGQPPLGLPPVPAPLDNPPTPEKIALGRKLFFDRRLSFNETMSCGMCHIPEQGFTNNELATPVGVEGRSLRRNSPTVLNSAYVERPFHDGRETSLETQIISPLLAKNEMANPSIGWVIAKIASLPDYDGMFEASFGGGPSIERAGQAIASWERGMLAGNSPFDRWYYGEDADAMTKQQRRGFGVFAGKGKCVGCHIISDRHTLFADHSFHDTGIGYFDSHVAARDDSPVTVEIAPGMKIPVDRALIRSVGEEREPDLGRYEITLEDADKWRFRTPSLRNVALTAPYMHDGSLRTLEDVVRFYDRGGIAHEGLDPLIQALELSDTEVAALVAFLESLTSDDIATLVGDARSVGLGN